MEDFFCVFLIGLAWRDFQRDVREVKERFMPVELQQHNDYIHSITACTFQNLAIGVHCHFGQVFVRRNT